MTIGCLIDDASLAFAYNKNTLKRPIIGCGAILDGQPKLLPMISWRRVVAGRVRRLNHMDWKEAIRPSCQSEHIVQ
jgi:hypothetical protein